MSETKGKVEDFNVTLHSNPEGKFFHIGGCTHIKKVDYCINIQSIAVFKLLPCEHCLNSEELMNITKAIHALESNKDAYHKKWMNECEAITRMEKITKELGAVKSMMTQDCSTVIYGMQDHIDFSKIFAERYKAYVTDYTDEISIRLMRLKTLIDKKVTTVFNKMNT